jgi:HSP20 family molecular chaperone IbpA
MTQTIEKKEDQGTRPVAMPRTDVRETDEAIILTADMPGADESSLELTLQDDLLVLRGKPLPTPGDGWKLEWAEYELCDYERSFRLVTEIDREAIQATMRNGTLRVVLPKKKPRTSRIEVRSA